MVVSGQLIGWLVTDPPIGRTCVQPRSVVYDPKRPSFRYSVYFLDRGIPVLWWRIDRTAAKVGWNPGYGVAVNLRSSAISQMRCRWGRDRVAIIEPDGTSHV